MQKSPVTSPRTYSWKMEMLDLEQGRFHHRVLCLGCTCVFSMRWRGHWVTAEARGLQVRSCWQNVGKMHARQRPGHRGLYAIVMNGPETAAFRAWTLGLPHPPTGLEVQCWGGEGQVSPASVRGKHFSPDLFHSSLLQMDCAFCEL